MPTKTFVTQTRMGTIVGESSEREVTSRDVRKAIEEAPKGTISIQFFDREYAEIDGETLIGKPKNHSPDYMINGTEMTLADVRLANTNGNLDILISNMESNGWSSVWRTHWGRFVPIPNNAQVA